MPPNLPILKCNAIKTLLSHERGLKEENSFYTYHLFFAKHCGDSVEAGWRSNTHKSGVSSFEIF